MREAPRWPWAPPRPGITHEPSLGHTSAAGGGGTCGPLCAAAAGCVHRAFTRRWRRRLSREGLGVSDGFGGDGMRVGRGRVGRSDFFVREAAAGASGGWVREAPRWPWAPPRPGINPEPPLERTSAASGGGMWIRYTQRCAGRRADAGLVPDPGHVRAMPLTAARSWRTTVLLCCLGYVLCRFLENRLDGFASALRWSGQLCAAAMIAHAWRGCAGRQRNAGSSNVSSRSNSRWRASSELRKHSWYRHTCPGGRYAE